MCCRRGSTLAAAVAVAAAGCFAPAPIAGLPCADGNLCPGGQVCDIAAGVCVPDSTIDTWRDDTATDFADPSAVLVDATIEANGAIGPTPYFVEGLATFGIDAEAIGIGGEASVTWAEIASHPTAGRGFARSLDIDYGSYPPAGSGLSVDDHITTRIEGEIYLEAGTAELELDVDDRGFFELGDPATGAFTRVVAGDLTVNATGTTSVPTAGWYPFRGAFEEDVGLHYFTILVGYGGAATTAVPAARLRTRVDGLSGLTLDGFRDSWAQTPNGATLAQDELVAMDFGLTYPDDLGNLGAGTWTARWSGQVLVTIAGAYAFQLDTLGGHRMWVDGAMLEDDLSGSARLNVTAPVDLDVGWHDLVIDVMKSSSSTSPSHAFITVDDGPELIGSFFPVERMRPVVGRGARWVARSDYTALPIPNMGSAARQIDADPPAGYLPILADFNFGLTHPVLTSIGVTVSRPDGSTSTIETPGSLTGTGSHTDHLRYTGTGGTGTWGVTVTDTVADAMTGMIDYARVSVTYAGGTAPFPTRAMYTSRVRDLGPVVSISGVRWQARQARDGGAVVVRVRSCADPATCASEAWHDVAQSGDVAGVAAQRYLQYQIEITTNGDLATGLDWIEIDYRLPG